MSDTYEVKIIARIRTDYKEKFGIPRQSGVVSQTLARIIFEPEYRNPDALRGIEGFSHLWLIWQFSKALRADWSPTVRPPKLGGNERMGVFATRSPFRPNAIGLSSVKLEGVETDPELGAVLIVSGADLMDGTPIFDIKPYLAYTDSHPDAREGFAGASQWPRLEVEIPSALEILIPADKLPALREVLANDPRPSYQNDPERVYGLTFGALDYKFKVNGNTLTVISIMQ